MSLCALLPLLVLGLARVMVGICTYAWAQHPIVVASLAVAAPLPFIVGDFSIGWNRDRREKLIIRLSEMPGDW